MIGTRLTPLDLTVLIVYLGALVGIGIWLARREQTTHDFFLAGRRIPAWAAGLSIFGTQLSAITFMAVPAKSFVEDWLFFPANMTTVLLAPVVAYLYLPFYRRLDLTTAYEYLERRFNLAVRWFGSIAFVVFQLGRMAIVVALPAIALAAVTGINVYACILVIGVLSTVYTVLGGIEAVVWTDVLQVFVLLGGSIVSLILMMGGIDLSAAEAFEYASREGKLKVVNWSWDATVASFWVVVVGNLFSNLTPYTTDQTVIQRYLTTRDERGARFAIWTNALLAIPATLLFFTIGTALFVFYQSAPDSVARLPDTLSTDAIYPWFIASQLPAGLSGLVIAGLFAASMSSLDSSLNSMATAIVTDFYARLRPASSDRKRLRLARQLTIVLGVVGTSTALAMATFEIKSLWDVFLAVLGLFGSSLAAVFILGIFTERTSSSGALLGAATSIVVLYLAQSHTDIHFFLYAPIGVSTALVVGYLSSLLRGSDRERARPLTIYGRHFRGPES